MQYAKQAKKPEWFNSDASKIYASATSGDSVFNEWYQFESHKEAIESITRLFNSQSFLDHFTLGPYGNHYYHSNGVVASIQEMVEFESIF